MARSTNLKVRAGVVAVAVSVGAVLGLVPAAPAGAAGVTTHAWMAATAIDKVSSPKLHALLVANKDEVRAGAHFPDSGYALTNKYGEEAHWQRYVDALVKQVRTHTECTDLAAPHGPCAKLVAFTMGIAAHGMGDEVWDWLFEPNVADLGEYYTPADLGTFANEGGAETQMDIAAIADFGQPTTPTVAFPNHADLLAAFTAVDFHDVDDSQLNLGQIAMDVLHRVEGAWAPTHIAGVHAAMPWSSHNLVTAPGGVDFAATAIAGYWDNTWGQLIGAQPATKVAITYPSPDQRRIPATGWVRDHAPGSGRDRGGARTRIAAALTYSRPYVTPGGSPVSATLPAGAMTLTVRDTGAPVAVADGYPKSVPYGPDAGEHMIDIQPAADLAPCTWYQASTTTALLDAHGKAVTPTSWDFRTGTDAAGGRCADDPYTADERFVRAVSQDLLGRDATEAELQAAGDAFARGRSRSTHAAGVLGSTEERTRLVAAAFQRFLGRAPDAAGSTYWATKLQTISIPDLQARLVGSAEVFRTAGSTNLGFVQALYPLVQGRPADAAGAAYWAARLDAGLTRPAFAKLLLTSREAAARTVTEAFQALLDRAPDAGGATYWTAYLRRGKDPRDLWKALVLTPEYDRHAQAS